MQIQEDVTCEQETYDRIQMLQKRVFGQSWPRRNKDAAIQEYCKLLGVEVSELLQETNYRVHKEVRPLDEERIKDEIADILIYTFAVAGVVFESYADFFAQVMAKVEKNNLRQDWIINQ